MHMELSCRLCLTFVSVVGSVVCFCRLYWQLSCRSYLFFVALVCISRLFLSIVLWVELAFILSCLPSFELVRVVVCFCRLRPSFVLGV